MFPANQLSNHCLLYTSIEKYEQDNGEIELNNMDVTD